MVMGYHQIELKEEDKDKTAFSTKNGHWAYNILCDCRKIENKKHILSLCLELAKVSSYDFFYVMAPEQSLLF
jgi:hypothetical protein